MPYTVEVPGRGVVEVPDDVPLEEASREIEKAFPPTGEEVASILSSNPDYVPTVEEFKLFKDYSAQKSVDWSEAIAQGIDSILQTAESAAVAGVSGAALNPANYLEGFAQGTQQMVDLVSQSQDPESPLFKFKNYITGDGSIESQRQQFIEARKQAKEADQYARGEKTFLPKELVNPEYVQGVAMVADPSLFFPGLGQVLGAEKVAAKAVGKAVQATGRAVQAVSRPVQRAAAAVGEKLTEAVGTSPEAMRGALATSGVLAATGAGPAVGLVGAIPVVAGAATDIGTALEAAGGQLYRAPTRIGALESIGKIPEANLRQRVIGTIGRYGGDAALNAALVGTTGSLEGAAIGGALGYLSGGEEGAAAGIGSGAAAGALGSLGARGVQTLTGQQARAARKGDFDRYVAAQDEKTAGLLLDLEARHGLDVASSFMDATGVVRGVLGDVGVNLLSSEDFRKKFGVGSRGVQVVEAETPAVYINADIYGKGKGDNPLYTLGHEMFHAFESSQQLADRASEVKDALVGSYVTKDGVVTKVTNGLFDDAEVDRRFNEYRDKLTPERAASLAEYDTTEKRGRFIASEIAGEYMGALLAGQKPDSMLRGFGGSTRSLLDSVLMKNADSTLNRIAQKIEQTFGTKPVDSVLFPEIKKASPQLNAMLRDLVRARGKLDERILAGDNDVTRAVRPGDMGNPISAKIAEDFGLAETENGVTRWLSDEVINLRNNRDNTAIQDILLTRPGARLIDGAIYGRLSPEQLSAIEQSQQVSSRAKDKIRAVAAAIENGNSIFIDYNAATRRVLNKLTGKYRSVYSSGIRLSQREVLPYAFYFSQADNPVIKAIDITKMRRVLEKMTASDGTVSGQWQNIDGFMSDFARYLTNLDSGMRDPSAKLFGEEKAKILANVFNEQEKGGRKFIRDFRLDRMGSVDPRNFRAKVSEEAIQFSKLRWMPDETVGDTRVINSEEGYRIVAKDKYRLYGPDGKLIGIYDKQQQAERKADATETRLQPEIDQQQRPARNEGRQTAEAGGGNRPVSRTQGSQAGGEVNQQVRQAGDVRFMPMSDLEKSDIDLRISTRNPSAKKATENPLTQQLSIDLESITRTPGALPEIINTVGKYPGIRFERSGSVNRANDFIRFVANNLIYLHDSVLPEIRQRSKLWYDGARKLTEDWSKRFGTTREGVAGVIASLSPQKDWYQNVTLAERVFEVVKSRQDEAFTGPIEQWARRKMTSGQNPKRLIQDEVINGMAGKKFSQLSDYEKAVFVRAFDEVNNTRTYPIVSPEGQMLDIARKADGTPATYAWGDFNSIAKAVKIAENPNKKTISESLGFEHKVRSFYDNILLPNNPEHGDVTIDTHAVAAALMLPLAGSDVYVAHNFGQGVPGSSVYGTSGTYGIYADAYRLAAKERGILPREMQSITWEAIRGLFTPEFKTAQNKKVVESIWKEYKTKKATLDETRQRIVDAAGGFRNPSWYGSGGGTVAENAPAVESQKLFGTSGLGGSRTDAGRRGSVPESGAKEIGGQPRFMPSDADYLAAVQAGDTQAAQQMVDQAAKAAGYDTRGLWRSVRRNKSGSELESREQSYVTDDLEAAKSYKHGIKYALQKVYAKLGNTLEIRSKDDLKRLVPEIDLSGDEYVFESLDKKPVRQKIWSLGYDSVKFTDLTPDNTMEHTSWLLKDSGTIKSSNPITRDNSGNVIPLSQRFQQSSADIRYMPQPDPSVPGAYSFTGGFRILPGKTGGRLRVYGPSGALVGIAGSLDEAQRMIRKKTKTN